ncbi:MAG: hypothetical protein ABSE62_07930 [Chthoniobacteraceae bacterium]
MSVLNKLLRVIGREWALFREIIRSGAFRELVAWCLPALILGALARAALTLHFPYGYFQEDTADFLVTAERLLRHHALVIHGKKAFLAPICFTIPFLLHIPALIVIPIVQHLAGLAATVLAGGIVRFWFRYWRWFVVPVTTLYTLNPALLWYEHALLAESHYLFCVTALALVGTMLARRATLRRFVWLIVVLFLTAGSRPEGKLFVAFGLGLVALVYLGDWKLWARRMGVMLLCSAGIWMSSRSTQAGLLLYATVVQLAPALSTVAPGIEPYVKSLRAAGLSEEQTARMKYNTVERRANGAIHAYLKSIGKPSDDKHVGALAQKLAFEAIRCRPQVLPYLAASKFLIPCRVNPGGDYTDTSGSYTPLWIYQKQGEALLRRKAMKPLMKGLTGRSLASDPEIEAFLHQEYKPLAPDWFGPLQAEWSRLTLGYQLHSHGADKRFIPGWPAYFLVAAAGMLVSLFPRDRLWRFHWPWVTVFLGVWFAVMITGVIQPRYRFLYEVFAIFYVFLLLDFLWSGIAGLANLARGGRPMQPAQS